MNFLFVHLLNLQTERYIVIDCHVTEQCIILKYKSDSAFTGRNIIDNFSVNNDFSAVRCFQTCDHSKNGCFSASTWPQQADQLTFFDSEIHIS